jgi:hypothetical protein
VISTTAISIKSGAACMQGSKGGSGIRVSGHTLVLDIFSRGAVMLEAEVKEFFNVETLKPSSDRCVPMLIRFCLFFKACYTPLLNV